MNASHSGIEKRKSPRANLSLLVQFRFDSLEQFVADYATDISMGGMFIRTDAPRPAGAMLYLQFTLRDGAKLIEGLGRVVHVNGPGTRSPGMGVEFVNFDEDSMALVEDIVRSNLARGKRA